MLSPEVVQLLEDYRVGWITIADPKHGEITLDCALRLTSHAFLEARFAPGTLPEGLLAIGLPCRAVCEVCMSVLYFQSRIESIANGHLLQLRIEGGSSHGDPRHHFRVEANLSLSYWKIGESPPAPQPVDVNLSRGGLRFTTSKNLELGERLAVELWLPGAVSKVVRAKGKVVGVLRKDEQGQEVVLKFTDIASDHLGRLSEFCLGLKFRQMGKRAELLGSILKPVFPSGQS
ncbi:MAG: PilZ domain-containing protein [Desulfuromonadaceae bacterium]|jgi:hypothetical protein